MAWHAMGLIPWSVSVLLSLMAIVIAARSMRRDDPSPKAALGSISGSWLTEHEAKHRQGRS